MKKFELIITSILVPLDYLFLLLAAISAYYLRYDILSDQLKPVVYSFSLTTYLSVASIVLIFWVIILGLSGSYSFSRQSMGQELKQVFLGCSTATMLIIIAFFFNAQFFSSRFIILALWILAIVFLVLERTLIHFFKKFFYLYGFGVKKIIVIGADANTFNLIGLIKKKPIFGLRVIEHLDRFTNKEKEYLFQLNKKSAIDEIIQADANLSLGQKEDLFNFCQENQIGFKYIASLLETRLTNFVINTFGEWPIIEIRHTKLDGWGRITKRIIDLIISLISCIILIPISIIVGLIIIIDSTGPVFVSLIRVGFRGNLFNLYKFRSMVNNAKQLKDTIIQFNERAGGPLFKMKNDPRITKIGKFLRQYSIDELPQFYNVLKGEMSIVGPRPHEPGEVAKYENYQKKLFNIKPGITGLAQVSGRSELLFSEEVRLDSYYIENWSVWLDFYIMIKTFYVIIFRKNVA
ncbi:MAG: hypothetical protein COX77_00020 [Candidatus Komeilibacteria bacterium CG_4_10_14_0_2_um_filter_37_10]|uniref:Bacterial sugar transferase domain-containing protein n=1 Tax=Candidatus Komeilibacteria bacterium CG_4_10_14_0_2_um_filter_37_10 TaxID=1974470 RepID=A0A2M7VGX0_9BACT|nr:MAG: hypothetical protein COX77_00020 [Candidatus Komeilibacteria bacterium CG_4_10_14_0_2_um_filter_37_10]